MLRVDCIPAFEDNYIWLVHTGAGRALIVDPGDADPVLSVLSEQRLELEAILITHHHRDHTAGIAALRLHRDVPVIGPAAEAIPGRTHPVTEGDRLDFSGSISFRVAATPGHTRGHVCYYGHGALFCGDTLFTGGCGRLFEGTAAQMYASLEKLRSLPDDTLVFCAHEYTEASLAFAQKAEPGNAAIRSRQADAASERQAGRPTVPSTLGLEKQTNPFLRSHEPELIAAAEAFVGHPLQSGAEVFGAIRDWKDKLD